MTHSWMRYVQLRSPRGDVRLANHVRAQHLPEQVQLRLARRGALRRDREDRAVALAQPDRPVRADDRARQVALLVLDDRELADLGLERGVGWESLVEPGPAPGRRSAGAGRRRPGRRAHPRRRSRPQPGDRPRARRSSTGRRSGRPGSRRTGGAGGRRRGGPSVGRRGRPPRGNASCWRMPVRLAPSIVASCSGELGPSFRSWTRISRRRPVAAGWAGTRPVRSERGFG